MRLADLLLVLDAGTRYAVYDRDGFELDRDDYSMADYIVCVDAHGWDALGLDMLIYIDK